MNTAYRTLWIASALSFLATFGIALPYPVLTPLLVATDNGLSPWLGLQPKLLLGLVLAAYPLGMLVGANLIGGWSDRYGRRPVILRTLAGAVTGYGLSVLAIINGDYLLLLISRLLTGFCEGNVAVFRAMAADLGDVIPRTRIFSWAMTATFLGWTFGPLAGGLLMTYGAAAVFFSGVLLLSAGWLLVALLLPATAADKTSSEAPGTPPRQSLSLYRLADIRGFALSHFLACLAINAYYEFYPLWLVERLQLASLGIATFTLALQVGMLASSMYLMRWFEQRYGLVRSMHVALAVLGSGLALLPLLHGMLLTAAAFTLIGVVNSTFFGLFVSEYSERFQHYGQGRILGLITFNFSLSSLLMALAGAALSLLGTGWVMMMGGLLGLSALVYLLQLRQQPRLLIGPVADKS